MLSAFCGPFVVNRIPESDRGDKQIWPAGPVALARERLVSDFPAPVEAYGPSQGVVGFSLLSPAVTRRLRAGALSHFSMETIRSIRPISRSARARLF
jgi:hypothetical protein